MSKNRRKSELPSQEESFQHILNRNTSTSILKHLRTWHHPGGSFLLPSATCSPCLGTLHPPGLGSLALLCTSLSVKRVLSLQKIWHLFLILVYNRKHKERREFVEKESRRYTPGSGSNSLCGIKKVKPCVSGFTSSTLTEGVGPEDLRGPPRSSKTWKVASVELTPRGCGDGVAGPALYMRQEGL